MKTSMKTPTWKPIFLDAILPKRCSRCGVEKIAGDFWGDCTTPDGRSYWCKSCKSAYAKDWYERVGRKQRQALKEFRMWVAQRLEELRLEQAQRAQVMAAQAAREDIARQAG